MSNKRPAIRAAIKSLIETEYNGIVETVREYKPDKEKEFILAYFTEGSLDGGLVAEYSATLEVAIFVRGAKNDNLLDAIGEQVETAIDSDPTLNSQVTGLISQGFEYLSNVDDRYNVLILRYTLKYPY